MLIFNSFFVVKMTERRKNQSEEWTYYTQLFIYFITVNKYRFCISVSVIKSKYQAITINYTHTHLHTHTSADEGLIAINCIKIIVYIVYVRVLCIFTTYVNTHTYSIYFENTCLYIYIFIFQYYKYIKIFLKYINTGMFLYLYIHIINIHSIGTYIL